MSSSIYSNVRIFYAIARESFDEMEARERAGKKPKPNGEPGYILTFDPTQKGFKSALLTIVFCGVCLETVLHLLIGKRLGSAKCKKVDGCTYEQKLILLGCNDRSILDACKDFREIRREIVHEKAFFDNGKSKIAQDEARRAIKLLESICRFFNVKLG